MHVLAERCASCIFRPGNLMRLEPGRLAEIVSEARAADSAIICHETAGADEAVCRGFADRWQTTPLQVADRLGFLELVPPPVEWWVRPAAASTGEHVVGYGASGHGAAGCGDRSALERGSR